jgi:hypothetical protein
MLKYGAIIIVLMIAMLLGWYWSLPRLDPTGKYDSSAAIKAMIDDRPVVNASSGWPMTRTGWPFFERYSPK